MKFGKKLLISVFWLIIFFIMPSIAGVFSPGVSTQGESSFGQLIANILSIFLVVALCLTPLVLSILVWFNRPKKLYKRFIKQGSKKDRGLSGTINTQLFVLTSYKKKYPNEEPTQLYVRVLAQRPGYGREEIKSVISQAQTGAAHGRYNFQSVVTSMLVSEEMEIQAEVPNEKIRQIVDTVEKLIPPSL